MKVRDATSSSSSPRMLNVQPAYIESRVWMTATLKREGNLSKEWLTEARVRR